MLIRRPLLIIIGFPCTLWCAFNVNFNYRDEKDLLEMLREADYRLLDLVYWTVGVQREGNRFVLYEDPPTAKVWQLIRDDFGPTGIGHGCAYGLLGVNGGLLRKAYKWATDSPVLLTAVTWRCDGTHEHEKVQGANTRLSGTYPQELADCVGNS